MEIFYSPKELNISERTSVALGNFDGIHIGHRVIMEDAISSAESLGLKSLCFTFSNHPFNFIMQRSDDDPHALKLICSEDEKVNLIREMGFDILVNIPFDEHIMTMSADDFFSGILLEKLNAGCVSAGFNYSYGARAGGNADTLKKACGRAGIDVNIHDAVRVESSIVSSTLIREMIKVGNMELCARYLGRPYSFKGTVRHGNRIGSAMGIPTVNIKAPTDLMLPPNGVYFSRIVIDGVEYAAVSNIGVKPTIGAYEKTIETNIFDFSGELYDKEIVVYFDHFSRAEVKFASKDELFEQIAADCNNAREYHKKR